MLALYRKPHEEIHCLLPDGQRIRIVVVETSSAGCKLAFEAQREIRILRSELLEEKAA